MKKARHRLTFHESVAQPDDIQKDAPGVHGNALLMHMICRGNSGLRGHAPEFATHRCQYIRGHRES
ncbi:hypothetical protein X734_31260 [Mesorhizobium sp. L2C084A000]|nr:hypothetical protein X734_31260 [Mesorhizobium sp. L2C084A000]